MANKQLILLIFTFFVINVTLAQSSTAFIVQNKKAIVYHIFSDCKALKKAKHRIIVTNENHCIEKGLRLCKLCNKSRNSCVPFINKTDTVQSNNNPKSIKIIPKFNQNESVKPFILYHKKHKTVPQFKK